MTETPSERADASVGAKIERVDLAREIPPVLGMALLFLVSILLAALVTPTYSEQDVQAFEDPESLANPFIYLAIVIVFTIVILLIAKFKRRRLLQYIILGATFMTINYVFWPLFALLPLGGLAALGGLTLSQVAVALSLALATALVLLLYYYPEWYVIDAVGVAVSAGAAAIFGISFGILPSLALLVAFAIYDAIAVYQTKHMIDLADNVLSLRLPIMFVVPKRRGYSFLREERRLKDQLADSDERDAMFMGLGDVVIPGVLIISCLHFLNPATYAAGEGPAWLLAATVMGAPAWAFVAFATLLGSLAGYALLMIFVLRGNPQAGLPLLNGGAIVGFLAALLPLYGLAPIVAPLCGFAAGLPGCA